MASQDKVLCVLVSCGPVSGTKYGMARRVKVSNGAVASGEVSCEMAMLGWVSYVLDWHVAQRFAKGLSQAQKFRLGKEVRGQQG